jgi:hypothetical protein
MIDQFLRKDTIKAGQGLQNVVLYLVRFDIQVRTSVKAVCGIHPETPANAGRFEPWGSIHRQKQFCPQDVPY